LVVDRDRVGEAVTPEDVHRFVLNGVPQDGPLVGGESKILLPGLRRAISPKTPGQRDYLQAIATTDIVVSIGPAGTGKTYLAVAKAVEAMARKREANHSGPAVEAGESSAFSRAFQEGGSLRRWRRRSRIVPPERSEGVEQRMDRAARFMRGALLGRVSSWTKRRTRRPADEDVSARLGEQQGGRGRQDPPTCPSGRIRIDPDRRILRHRWHCVLLPRRCDGSGTGWYGDHRAYAADQSG
jgi:hypothetical protein